MPIAAAIVPAVIGAGVTAGAGLIAADKQKDAIKDATKAQTASNAEALALQEKMNARQRADYAPWRAVGVGALQMLSRTMGVQVPDNVFYNSLDDVKGYTPPASTPATGGATGGAPATPGTPATQRLVTAAQSAEQQYLAANPDVAAEFARHTSKQDKKELAKLGITTADDFARWHYSQFGQKEGRQMPTATAAVYETVPGTPGTPAQPAQPATPAQPVTNAGGQPITSNGLPVTPETTKAANTGRYKDFFASPDYQFRLDEGSRAITGNAAAKGLLDSGALGKGLINYGQQAASQEFGNWFNRIATLAGYGQTAVNQSTAYGQAAANNQTGIIQNQGENLASSIATKGGITSGMIGNIGGAVGGLIQNVGGAIAGGGGMTGAGAMTAGQAWNNSMGGGWQSPMNPQGLVPTGSNLFGAVI